MGGSGGGGGGNRRGGIVKGEQRLVEEFASYTLFFISLSFCFTRYVPHYLSHLYWKLVLYIIERIKACVLSVLCSKGAKLPYMHCVYKSGGQGTCRARAPGLQIALSILPHDLHDLNTGKRRLAPTCESNQLAPFNKPQPKPLVGEKTVCGRIVSCDKGEVRK